MIVADSNDLLVRLAGREENLTFLALGNTNNTMKVQREGIEGRKQKEGNVTKRSTCT